MKKIECFIIFGFICAFVSIAFDYKYEEEKIKQTKLVKVDETKIEINTEELEEIKETEEYICMWTTKNTDIKKELNENSETVEVVNWNTELIVTYIDDNWAKIKDTEYYISRSNLCDYQSSYNDYDVPNNNGMKSYMDYRAITSVESNQYKLQQIANTDEDGIRKVNDRYCIAVGSYYTTNIGQYIDVELENGSIIYGILADCKDDKHTDSKNQIHINDGSVIEFVVDTNYLDVMAMKMGDISYINNWNSKVVNIKIYDKIEDF